MMMRKAIRGIAAIAIALAALLSPCETHCQYLDTEHQQILDNERKRLVTKFNDWQEKAKKAWDKGKYDEAVAYFKKCKE